MNRKVGLGVALTVVAAAAWLLAAPVQVGGRTAYLVTHGDSMEPSFRAGDLAILRATGTYRVGDVAAYSSRELQTVVMHRIVAVDDGRYTMQGDNNDFLDPEHPANDDLLGRLALRVPQGGTWLRRLTSPAALAVVAFSLLMGGGAATTVTRRRRGPQPEAARPAVTASLTLTPPVRAAAAIVAVAGVLAAALGFIASRPPATAAPQANPSASASMTYSYQARVRPSPAYDTNTVTDPQPVFRRLADTVEVAYAYKTSAAVSDGEIQTTVALSTANGWRSTVPVGAAVAFSGAARAGSFRLDLADLQTRAEAAARAIGAGPAGPVTVRVITHVAADQRQPFRPELGFLLDDAALRLGDDAPSSLTVEQPTSPVEAGLPAQAGRAGASLLGLTVPPRVARSAAVVAMLVALVAALVLAGAFRRTRRSPENVSIQQRHGSLLLPVEPMVLPPGRPVIDVPQIDGLVRLAQRYGLMVLHWNRGGVHTYVVFEDNTTYRFRLGERQCAADREIAPDHAAEGAEVHVTPYGARWAVRRADEGAPVSVHPDLDEAIECARVIASRGRASLIVFDSCWTRPEISLTVEAAGPPSSRAS